MFVLKKTIPNSLWFFVAEAISFEFEVFDEDFSMVKHGKGSAHRIDFPTRFLGKVMEFVANVCEKASELNHQSTILFKGGSVFLSCESNTWSNFIHICQWKMKTLNWFVIVLAGKDLAGWQNFLEVLRQTLNGSGIVNPNIGLKPLATITAPNPSRPHWVRPPEWSVWKNVVVCDVWGVTVPWKSVVTAVSYQFRGIGRDCFVMLPTSYPINRALFTNSFEDELNTILYIGRLHVGNGVVTFLKWVPNITSIPISAVSRNRGVRIWGLPLTKWRPEVFHTIGARCGGLLAIDGQTLKREVIFVARIKLGAESLADIPRMLSLECGGVTSVLVLEVEALVLTLQNFQEEERRTGWRRLEIRDDDLAPSKALVIIPTIRSALDPMVVESNWVPGIYRGKDGRAGGLNFRNSSFDIGGPSKPLDGDFPCNGREGNQKLVWHQKPVVPKVVGPINEIRLNRVRQTKLS